MKNKSKEYKISQELRKIAYMLCMVAVIFLADIAVVNATSEDDGAAAERILDNQIEENENRTNINDPGTAETGEDLKELNIANNLKITYDSGNGELNGTLRILLILTAIAVLPILLVTLTSFTRILIVLHFTRQALNTQSAPPNQVLIAISLFLTFYIMQPVFAKVYTEAIVPYDAGEIGFEEAIDIASAPMRDFMFEQTQRDDINVFMQISNVAWDGETFAQVPTTVLIPSFIVSELRTAFIIGFMIYVPFIVIDMVVASVLMSMGMMMLPPTTISMPFKILLFVLADGWSIVIVELVRTFK
ncbi:MAG: flagellar type III secretion system pore protein FliP [Lachnospiraceae bacterium]|jgi:flagellar biosynthetic protein FliP|nr:flagellar type III secretion system pore protein FliP [Lachnospiraceae bacterium]MCI8966019.1 flagellar type III secretion system pore protein FliP [Lachnospiraceae bacterium]